MTGKEVFHRPDVRVSRRFDMTPRKAALAQKPLDRHLSCQALVTIPIPTMEPL